MLLTSTRVAPKRAWHSAALYSLASMMVFASSLSCAGRTIRSTNGQLFPTNRSDEATRASASRDLRCPPNGIVVVPDQGNERASLVSVEGCGHRVTYMLSSGYNGHSRYVVISQGSLR